MIVGFLRKCFLKCLFVIKMNVQLKSGDFFRFDNDQGSIVCVKCGEFGKWDVLVRLVEFNQNYGIL